MFLSAARSRLPHVFLVTVVTIVLSAALFLSIHTTSQAAATNLALNRPVVASSVFRPVVDKAYVNDGSMSTRWTSQYSDPQWIYVDLGARYALQSVVLKWENAYGKAYSIQVSNDALNWTTVYSTTVGDGTTDTIMLNTTGRYVRMYGTKRATSYGYSLYEFEVYGTSIVTVPVPTVSLSAASALITEGQSTTLTWTSTNAASCTGTNFTTGGATNGSVTISPMATTTYGIACTGAGGTTSASTIVGVKLLPAIGATCSATPTAVYTGTIVTWTVSASGGNGTYTYNWNGADSLAGTAATISKIYTTAGTKSAQVSVSSGSKSTTITCANTVQVTEPDRQPPTVVVTAPLNGATVSGSIAVSGISSDNVGVVGVRFFLDGTTLLQDEKILPYSFGWNTLTTPDGSHTIVGVARDAAGNNATSAPVTFTVRNAPTATLTVASATITEDESTTLTWSSARATTCAGVGFTTGGATSGTVTVSPTATTTYTVTCTGPGGTTNASATVGVTLLPPITATCAANVATAYTGDTVTWSVLASGGNGSYRYTWTGTDGISGTTNPLPVTYALAGNKTAQVAIQSGTKSIIVPCASTVMIREPDRQAPSVNIASPFSATSVAGSVLITADASDNVGVVGVQYLLDGANLDTEKTITPYGLLWNTLLTSDGTHTLTAIARDAAGNNATSAPVTITVGNIPVVTFTTDTSLIVEGQSAMLSWTATNAQSCVGVGFTTNNATSGSVTVSPTATTTYGIACTGAGGTTNASATVGVTLLPPITATCAANVATAYTGDTVTWSVLASGGTGAYTYLWSGTDGLSGSTSAVSMAYTTSGTKTGQVTIVSGPKISTVTCTNPIEISVPLKFDIADRVLVSTDTTLNVRDSANGTVIGQQVNGVGGIVVGGPVYSGSLRWWNIDYDVGVDGWSAEDFLASDMPPHDQLPTIPDVPDVSM